MQEQYSVGVHNRFNTLQDVNETTTEKYKHFIKINKEVIEDLIPKMDKKKRFQPSKDL